MLHREFHGGNAAEIVLVDRAHETRVTTRFKPRGFLERRNRPSHQIDGMHAAFVTKRLHQMAHFIVDERVEHHEIIRLALGAMRFLMLTQKTRDFIKAANLGQRLDIRIGVAELPRRRAGERMGRRAERVAHNMNRGKRRIVVHSNKSFIRCHACPLSVANAEDERPATSRRARADRRCSFLRFIQKRNTAKRAHSEPKANGSSLWSDGALREAADLDEVQYSKRAHFRRPFQSSIISWPFCRSRQRL